MNLSTKKWSARQTSEAPGAPPHAGGGRQQRRSVASRKEEFQARACNTLAFRAVARSATHRHGACRPAPWLRARTGAHTATLPWRGARGAGKGVPPPPRQRRRPAGVARHLPEGPSLRCAAHLRTAGGAADTAHGRAGGTDRRATGRLQPRRSMASEIADEPPLQKLARRHDHPRVIVGGSNPGSRRARSPRATRGGGVGGQAPCDPCGRTVLLSHLTLFAFSVIATLPTLTRSQIPEDTNADCHL